MADLLFLTELLGLKVYDLKGRKIGALKDAALVPLVDAARVDRYLVGGGWAWLSVRHDQIRTISLDGIYLRDEQLTPYHSDEYVLRLVRDLLDQQIIDAQGRKVVRVTDITFDVIHREERDELRVLEVDIGLRAIYRRLLRGVVPPRWIRRTQSRISPHSIGWEYCNILEPDPQRRLRLNISNRLLEEMHPADLADIVEELGPDDREAIFETIDSEVAADTLSEVDPGIQASILESLETEKAADILEEMEAHDAADVLNELEEETSEEILEEMQPEEKTEVEELLEFDEDSAGGMMSRDYVALPRAVTVGEALTDLHSREELPETLNTLFLVDPAGRLTGAVALAKLFLSSATMPVEALAMEPLICVPEDESKDRITELFDKYNLLTLPVVDEEERLSGVITADEIITALRQK
jgi:CBS domain-containing protein/sporulation protein YlmC with PRC-barrel domain